MMRGVPQLSTFVSRWSAPAHWTLHEFAHRAKAAGFAGVEMSMRDLGATATERRAAAESIRSQQLRLVCGVYSSWVDYEGPWAPLSPAQHLETFKARHRCVCVCVCVCVCDA